MVLWHFTQKFRKSMKPGGVRSMPPVIPGRSMRPKNPQGVFIAPPGLDHRPAISKGICPDSELLTRLMEA
jgi:hypothetical protein